MELPKNTNDQPLKYCKHCGSKIPLRSDYCPYCGRDLLADQVRKEEVEVRGVQGYFIRNLRTVRIATFVLCTTVFVVGLIVGSQTSLSIDEAQLIIGETQEISTGSLVLQIAQNNILLCLLLFLPVLGVLLMAFISYGAGLVIAAYALLYAPTPPQLLQSLLLLPSTWLQFVAFGLAASEGILFLVGIITRRFKEEVRTLAKVILVCIALLITGAVIEVALLP